MTRPAPAGPVLTGAHHTRSSYAGGSGELEGYDEAAIDAKIDYLCPAG